MQRSATSKERDHLATKELIWAHSIGPESGSLQNLRLLRRDIHKTVHEISSPFQSIVCFLHLARYKLEERDAILRRHIEDMISQSERINGLLRRITALVDEAVKVQDSLPEQSSMDDAQLALELG